MKDLALYEKSNNYVSEIKFIFRDKLTPFPAHWHEHVEVHFVISGAIDIQCGGKVVHLKQNDCLIINPNELHLGIRDDNCNCLVFKVQPSFFDDRKYIFETVIHDDVVTSLMNKIIEISKNTDDASLFTTKGALYQFFGHLCRHYAIKSMSPYAPQQNDEKLIIMNKIASFLHSNYKSNIKTEDLVLLSHYNYSHFCHTFKEIFGVSSKQYLLSIRINKARSLLLTTNMSIAEISDACGFSDSNYFARAFKKEKGISPSLYREKKHD